MARLVQLKPECLLEKSCFHPAPEGSEGGGHLCLSRQALPEEENCYYIENALLETGFTPDYYFYSIENTSSKFQY